MGRYLSLSLIVGLGCLAAGGRTVPVTAEGADDATLACAAATVASSTESPDTAQTDPGGAGASGTIRRDTAQATVDARSVEPPKAKIVHASAMTGTGASDGLARAVVDSCSCGVDVEGNDVCFSNALCADVTACTSSLECPRGSRCVADNCCQAPKNFACFPACSTTQTCIDGGTCRTGYAPCSPDVCEDASLIAVGSQVYGDTTQATVDAAPTCDTAGEVSGPGVWYKVMGTGTTMGATTCSEFSTHPDTRLGVYCPECSDLRCVAGNDDSCVGFNTYLSTVQWCSELGAEYYILVHDYNAASGGGNFTLTLWDDGVTCPAAVNCAPSPPGDSCDRAVTIPGVPFTTQFDNSTALPSPPSGSCNALAATEMDSDVWYSYTAQVDCTLTVDVSDADLYDMIMSVHTGPDCASLTETVCVDDPEPYHLQISTVAGTTYWFQIGDWGTFPGGGVTSLDVDCVPTGACCDDSTGVCNDGTASVNCAAPLRFTEGTSCASLSPPCGQMAEACCAADGSCTEIRPDVCTSAAGTPQGIGTTCAGVTCPQLVAACCVSGACADEAQADCAASSGVWVANQSCAIFTCPPPPACPSNTLYGQLPNHPAEMWSFGVSDTDWPSGIAQRYESFAALNDPICDLHWWGVSNGGSGSCIENPMTFIIRFYENAVGAPVPGNEVCSYTISVDGIPTGWPYDVGELQEYHVDFASCCAVRDGWVSIQATGGADCLFWWLSSSAGDGKACFRKDANLDCSGNPPDTSYDLSLCLTGATAPLGACCDDGACIDLMTKERCLERGGNWFHGEECAAFVCPEACCFSDGRCADAGPTECRAINGIPRGPGTNCTNTSCPQPPQACCFAGVTCSAVLGGSCTAACPCKPDMNCDGALDGFDIAPFKEAMTDPVAYQNHFPLCPIAWADVDCDGDIDELDLHAFNCLLRISEPSECMTIDALSCTSHGGTALGPNTACANRQEACCTFPDGACLHRDPVCCAALRGSAQGPGPVCGDQVAACCLGPECTMVDPLCCDDLAGVPSPISETVCLQDNNGDGVDDACEGPPPVCDGGDTDDDGDLDLVDYSVFANCVGGPGTAPPSGECVRCFDYDGDGDVDARDVATFQRWFTGAP